MKKLKEFLSASKTNVAIFAVTAGLALSATIGGASAAISYIVETYSTEIEMYDIGVSLIENDVQVSYRDYNTRGDEWNEHTGILLENMIPKGEKVQFDYKYPEILQVYNSGHIDEYVRVTIYRYWTDESGTKQNVNPNLIDLHFLTDIGNGWTMDTSSLTNERVVLYYQSPLAVGDYTPPFADTLSIDEYVKEHPEEYDGMKFVLRVDVDAVQTHNAEDAIKSAWGVDMNAFGIQ